MARENFTAPRIAAFGCPDDKSQAFMWDSGSPGLGLRVTKTGAKAFIFQGKVRGGGDVRITIGDPATWRLPDAREKARQYMMLIDSGEDPRKIIAEKKAEQQAERAEQTARELKETLKARLAWDEYVLVKAKQWGEQHRRDHDIAASEGGTDCKIGNRKAKAGPLANLLDRPLHEITSEVVHDWLALESKTRATFAHNAYRKFRTFVNWCATHPQYKSIVHTDCCTSATVTTIVPKKRTKDSDSLQREQLHPWFAAVKTVQNPVLAAYFQALLITGARRTELTGLRWHDVDFQWKQMTIADKVNESRTIPLPPYLALVLNTLPRENDWVFSSLTSESGHIESPTKAHTAALKKAGLPHVSLHGLRRSFGTLAEWVDAPAGVVAQIMGHQPSAIAEKHYKRRDISFLRQWHVKIERWMLDEAGITWNN